MAKVGKLLVQWDESEIFESEYQAELEEMAEELSQGEITTEEIANSIYNDSYLFEIHYENFIHDLNFILNKKNKQGDGCWKVEVSNFGWRGSSGYKVFRADDAQQLLNNILPKTDCTFKVYNYGNGIAIQNYHHDSPTGREWYYIKPVAYSTYAKY